MYPEAPMNAAVLAQAQPVEATDSVETIIANSPQEQQQQTEPEDDEQEEGDSGRAGEKKKLQRRDTNDTGAGAPSPRPPAPSFARKEPTEDGDSGRVSTKKKLTKAKQAAGVAVLSMKSPTAAFTNAVVMPKPMAPRSRPRRASQTR